LVTAGPSYGAAVLVARLVVSLVLAGCCACSGGSTQPANPVGLRRLPDAGAASEDDRAIATLSGASLVKVPADTFGPYVGDRPGAAVAVWAALESAQKRAWFSSALSESGKPVGKPLRLGDAPRELGLVAVRPESDAGFIVLSTRKTEGEALDAVLLGPRGELRSPPATLTEQPGAIQWIEAIGTSQGTLVLWAARRDKQADLHALAVDRSGRKLGSGELVLSGARAWQAARTKDGAAVAAVIPQKPGAPLGTIQLTFVAADGKLAAKPVAVSTEPTAESDLDLAKVDDQLVLAWSDRREPEARIYSAAVNAAGAVTRKPAPAIEAFGEQALIRLVPPFASGNAYLAWESLLDRSLSGRHLQLATVKSDGSIGAERAVLTMLAEDGSIPELRAHSSGLAALTLAAACPRDQKCQDPERLPTFVGFDQALNVTASEPLRLNALGGRAATLAWGLTCAGPGCFLLAALPTAPAPVFTVELSARSNHWQPAARAVRPGPPPRARFVDAVAAGDPLSRVAAARVGDVALVSWLTYFDPTTPWERLKKAAPDGRFEPLQALLQIRAARSSNDAPSTPPQTLSLRARSLGGVAIAAGEPARNEALVVWSAIDAGQPQVFCTLVDAAGKRLQQRMLTRRKGEVSDVAVTFVGDGFVVGWVDERDGDPEVYAAKVNRMLMRVGPEQRVTKVKGAAADLTLLARGDHVIAAWADARNAEPEGWADIYTARLKSADASPLGGEQRVASTRLHSHSPALGALGTSTVLAWIDSTPESTLAGDDTGVRIVRLDAEAKAAGNPALLTPSSGVATAVSLDCSAERCRGVLSVDAAGSSELAGFEWKSDAAPRPRRLLTLTGPAAQLVSPVLLGSEAFFADLVDHKARVRRMGIVWE
jgi:hypothetical protein